MAYTPAPSRAVTGERRTYTTEEKHAAVVMYYVEGNFESAARKLNMSGRTLSSWATKDWWLDIADQVAKECEDKIRANYDKIIELSQGEVIDRLEKGDTHVRPNGEILRVPIKAKDAAVISAVSYDKRRISLNLPTSISGNVGTTKQLESLAKQFVDIAQKFEEKNVNTMEGECMLEIESESKK